MLKTLRRVLTALMFIAGLSGLTVSAAQPTSGIIRVKLQPEMARQVGQAPRMRARGSDKLLTGVTPLDNAVARVKAFSLQRMIPYAPRFEAQRARYGLDRWYVLSFDESVSPAEARRILATVPGVEIAETVTPMSLKEGGNGVRPLPGTARVAAEMPFNDPRLPQQWHYHNDGSIGGTVAGADINLFEGWKLSTGDPSVIVAIIDGGIDYKHEDLAANVLVNQAELNGTPGVDDDGNGYVDDIYGFNFCTNTADVSPHNHGTHVAGTVGAVNNNGIGVAGVAGGNGTPGSGVKLLSCQVFDARSGVGEGDFAAAFVYAAERGATIAQCSWGWDAPDYIEQAVLDAIDYFTETARSDRMSGGLAIFAAGNMGAEGNYYPACYEKCVAVASMTSEFLPASYSNYGDWVDLVAPGGLLDYGESQGVLSTIPNNGYGFLEGTSMATPHVSGIAALVLSRYGSPTFVNESLRNQLINSVNDFYSKANNAAYAGKFGSGYIDAVKALNMGDGTPPAAVSDLKAEAGQDYLVLSWTIPSSADNVVNSHIVYYSTNAFDASTDVSTLQSKNVDTKFLSSGDHFETEIGGLSPLTAYYVAVVAVNRQGQPSAMSEVKSVMTNAGPEMALSESSLTLNSGASAPVASASFEIGNNAEGLLKWSISSRTVSTRAQAPARPMAGRIVPYKGHLATAAAPKNYPAVLAEYDAGDYPAEIFYNEILSAYIGDTDNSLPNSMAQWFKVDAAQYPDGFNLTHLSIDGNYGREPVIQIYRGDVAISSATLIQTIDYQWFAYNYNIALNEQLHFAPGEAFWVVVHFDGGQEGYPLGLGYTPGADLSGMAYMSNDKGRTWTRLPEALKGSVYEALGNGVCWAIKARSLNPDWSEALAIEPVSGIVRQGETATVSVSADGSRFVNGTYNFNLNVTTNEGDGRVVALPVSYIVEGNAPDLIMPRIVDFGSLLVGQSKTLTIEAFNRGFGKFSASAFGGIYSDNISVSNENFKGPDYLPAGFPARAKTTFDVTFAPTAAGPQTGTITFTDYEGREARVLVQGVATEPARLAIDPAVVEAGSLVCGADPVKVSFAIANEGKYPMEYVFPRFSDETIEAAGTLHRFGYSVASNLEGYPSFEYDGNPDLLAPTDIASQFTDDNVVSEAIDLGFSFPYYGKTYDKVYVTSYGGVMFAKPELNFWPPLTPGSSSIKGIGLISMYGAQMLMSPSSQVLYAKQDGKFVIKFVNVLATVYGNDNIPVSYHMTLSANGDIEMFYDDYDASSVFQNGSGLFCGINDPDVADPLTVTSNDRADYWGNEEPTPENRRFMLFTSGTAVRFEAPKPSFVKALSAPAGVVAPGERVDIEATLSADDSMYAGETFNMLSIVTTDPSPAYSGVRINATIDGTGLNGVAALDNTDIKFGDVYRTSVVKLPVTVKNTGRNLLTVNNVAFSSGKMTVEAQLPLEIRPGMSKDFVVTVPTAVEGELSDRLDITTDCGNLSATISGRVIGCPGVELSFESIDETVAGGTPLQKALAISNDGNETLRYAITPNPIARLSVPERDGSSVSYNYTSSIDDASASRPWVDIETNGRGTHHDITYYMEHDYVAVDLPFEFPFYGKKYSKMYIYNTGFVSFTERPDNKLWPEPPAEFPDATIYTNIIAPYWGMHSMDQTKTAGTYYEVTENRAIVSFMEYGNSMNIGCCFQLILDKDGSFSFAYKAYDDNAQMMGTFGLAGISNEDASSHIRVPERMMTFGQSISFTPVTELSLAPGANDEIKFDFDTNRMAGTYTTAFIISTNKPGSESIEIPVTLNVTGDAVPIWPEDKTVEHTYGFRSTDYTNPVVQMGACYDAPFEVGNTGNAEFTILGVQVDGPMIYDEWFDMYTPVFNLLVNAPEVDWITGEPTGNYVWMMYDGMQTFDVGERPVQFSLPMMECEQWMTPGEYEVPVTFTYTPVKFDPMSFDEPEMLTKTVTVKFVVTEAPVLTLDKEMIAAVADDDNELIVETVNMSNTGAYRLDYSMYIDPTGVGETPEEPGGGIDPWMAPRKAKSALAAEGAAMPEAVRTPARVAKPFDRSDNAYDCPQDFEYRNALFYPTIDGTRSVYNYGSGRTDAKFSAATQFTTPAEGFNISHIYCPVTIESARNVQVDVKVVQGEEPWGETVLAEGSVFIPSQENPSVGSFHAIALDHSVYMNPGEKFCVVISYPEGINSPAYLAAKQEGYIENRYYGFVEDYGWYDVAGVLNDQYGSLGYLISCLETVEGSTWVKLLNPESEGSLDVNASADVRIQLNAATSRLEKNNQAMLVIKTNDPERQLINFPITLDRNGRPQIIGPDSRIYVKEGETSSVVLEVTDPEGDAMKMRFSDVDNLAAATSVLADGNSLEADADGIYTVPANTALTTVNVGLTADFGDAGEGYAFSLTVMDDSNHRTEYIGRYAVEKVNRAPEVKETETVRVDLNGLSPVVNFADLFEEPDGEEMTFEFAGVADDIVEAYTTSTGVVFFGKKKGTSSATVVATDPAGLTATAVVPVEVGEFSGIDTVADGRGSLRLLENPVADVARVECGFGGAGTLFEVYDINGNLMLKTSLDVSVGETVTLRVDNLSAGHYLLKATNGRVTGVARIVKL